VAPDAAGASIATSASMAAATPAIHRNGIRPRIGGASRVLSGGPAPSPPLDARPAEGL